MSTLSGCVAQGSVSGDLTKRSSAECVDVDRFRLTADGRPRPAECPRSRKADLREDQFEIDCFDRRRPPERGVAGGRDLGLGARSAQRAAPGRRWRRRHTKELSFRARSTRCYKLPFLDSVLAEVDCDAQDEVTRH